MFMNHRACKMQLFTSREEMCWELQDYCEQCWAEEERIHNSKTDL